jgi:hypothetical protein
VSNTVLAPAVDRVGGVRRVLGAAVKQVGSRRRSGRGSGGNGSSRGSRSRGSRSTTSSDSSSGSIGGCLGLSGAGRE